MPRKKSIFKKLFSIEEKEGEEKENPKIEVETPKKKESEKPALKTGAAEKEEEWTSQYEGQLTIDVYQTKDDIVIKSTIAGVKPEDIDISLDEDMITIKGERKNEEKISQEDYFYQECYWGAFSRSVILPCEVDADKAQAELKNGILTVRLPKIKKTTTKKIEVKAG